MKSKLVYILLFLFIFFSCSSQEEYELMIESDSTWSGLISEFKQNIKNPDKVNFSRTTYSNTSYIEGEGGFIFDISNYLSIWSIVKSDANNANLKLKVIKKVKSYFILFPVGHSSEIVAFDEINFNKKYAEIWYSFPG